MSDNKSKKMPGILARLRMVVGLNIGTIMFGILFIYMAFSAILYFTTTHIESYQVTSGPLSRNETYTGLAIREESLCKADSSGYITYYAREGSKINASGAVYGLSDTKTASAPASLAPEELSKVRTDMMSFSKGFSSSKFNSTYSFKYELKGNILQYAESGNTSSAPLTSDEENLSSNTFLKTISAYANYGEGKIIFGINDQGNVIGITDPVNGCLNLENKINDSLSPVPEFRLEIQENTIVLTVYEGRYKPYLYKGKAYKRNDSSTVEVDRLEYNRLILEGCNQTFEEITSFNQQLTFAKLETEFIRVMGIEKINKDILKTLELYSDQSGFNNAAALLADDNQFTGIDIIRFGDTIDEIMDRESLENISILSQLEKTLQMFRKYYQYEKIEGAERKCIDKIPEKAFREAIANALIHRMWDIPASIKVSMYADRIEISSPGGLPVGISEEEYLNGQISILRNPIIGNVFFRLKYIEKFGTGIMRINHAYRNALIKPSYQCFSNSIKVILPVIRENYDLSEAEQILVSILKGKEKMSRSEIEKAAEMEKSKAVRTLNSLIEKKILKKTGAGRGVRYTLK